MMSCRLKRYDELSVRNYGYNNKEIRDNRVAFFVTHLDQGAHTFTYLARATQAGMFSAMPAQVVLMYAPEVWGRSASGAIRVGDVNTLPVFVPVAQIGRAEKMLER
jgi:uncharacterized protein YfaS (alpha-2-macroglobulin family)